MNEKELWKKFVDEMVDTYGVESYYDNGGEENDDIWFMTPCCHDVIYWEDYDLDKIKEICPICENRYDEG